MDSVNIPKNLDEEYYPCIISRKADWAISNTQGKPVLILQTDGNANYLLEYNVAWQYPRREYKILDRYYKLYSANIVFVISTKWAINWESNILCNMACKSELPLCANSWISCMQAKQ